MFHQVFICDTGQQEDAAEAGTSQELTDLDNSMKQEPAEYMGMETETNPMTDEVLDTFENDEYKSQTAAGEPDVIENLVAEADSKVATKNDYTSGKMLKKCRVKRNKITLDTEPCYITSTVDGHVKTKQRTATVSRQFQETSHQRTRGFDQMNLKIENVVGNAVDHHSSQSGEKVKKKKKKKYYVFNVVINDNNAIPSTTPIVGTSSSSSSQTAAVASNLSEETVQNIVSEVVKNLPTLKRNLRQSLNDNKTYLQHSNNTSYITNPTTVISQVKSNENKNLDTNDKNEVTGEMVNGRFTLVQKCKKCKLRFQTKDELEKHKKSCMTVYHKPVVCRACGKIVEESNYPQHRSAHRNLKNVHS